MDRACETGWLARPQTSSLAAAFPDRDSGGGRESIREASRRGGKPRPPQRPPAAATFVQTSRRRDSVGWVCAERAAARVAWPLRIAHISRDRPNQGDRAQGRVRRPAAARHVVGRRWRLAARRHWRRVGDRPLDSPAAVVWRPAIRGDRVRPVDLRHRRGASCPVAGVAAYLPARRASTRWSPFGTAEPSSPRSELFFRHASSVAICPSSADGARAGEGGGAKEFASSTRHSEMDGLELVRPITTAARPERSDEL